METRIRCPWFEFRGAVTLVQGPVSGVRVRGPRWGCAAANFEIFLSRNCRVGTNTHTHTHVSEIYITSFILIWLFSFNFVSHANRRRLQKCEGGWQGVRLAGAWGCFFLRGIRGVGGWLDSLTSSGASKRNSGIKKKHPLDSREQRRMKGWFGEVRRYDTLDISYIKLYVMLCYVYISLI